MDHLRYACPGCGGNGEVRAESFEHYEARLLTLLDSQGFYTLGDAIIRMRECVACDGTGRDKYAAGLIP